MSTDLSTKLGIHPEPRTVRLERVLPGPIERVWQYLTDPKKREIWFAGGPMELHVGGRAELHFDHRKISPEPLPEKYREKMEKGEMISIGHVTQCEPPTLLSYTWWENEDDKSEITFELTPQGEDDVKLVITHRRLESRQEVINVSSGWHLHLDILEDRLRGAEPRPFWGHLGTLQAEYEKVVPREE